MMPIASESGKKPDLLAHKYRPNTGDGFRCHQEQATRLKLWIQDFMNHASVQQSPSDFNHYDSSSDSCDIMPPVAKNCALLTGPPGVGKTSLVYAIAEELKLHVVESHASEKRDAKLFTTLKLANQKGKINPIAKLFQAALQTNQSNGSGGRRKRRKLTETSEPSQPQCLSLSGDASILLFDDIDVVFEEDGPFLKSLVEFIRESKRPVIVTATQSIDRLKRVLAHIEHIHLEQPSIDDCANLLKDICKRESYPKLGKSTRCLTIAEQLDCDIRQCLNRIHFYGDLADQIKPAFSKVEPFITNIAKLNLTDLESNKSILDCYNLSSLLDLMDSKLRSADKTTLRERWLDGQPAVRNEDPGFNDDLGEQIQEAILELSKNLHSEEKFSSDESAKRSKELLEVRNKLSTVSRLINEKIESRVEPPDQEFFVDIVPYCCDIINLEATKRSTQPNGISSRRSRRTLSYLDSIGVYLNPEDFLLISQNFGYEQVR